MTFGVSQPSESCRTCSIDKTTDQPPAEVRPLYSDHRQLAHRHKELRGGAMLPHRGETLILHSMRRPQRMFDISPSSTWLDTGLAATWYEATERVWLNTRGNATVTSPLPDVRVLGMYCSNYLRQDGDVIYDALANGTCTRPFHHASPLISCISGVSNGSCHSARTNGIASTGCSRE